MDKVSLGMVSIRLVKDRSLMSLKKINSPDDACNLLGKHISEMDREVLCMINLDTQLRPINCSIVSMGTVNSTVINIKEIFKTALLSNAYGIMILHNHPSGSLNPSEDDIRSTERIKECCNLMGFKLVDHIIIAPKINSETFDYYSFLGNGLLSNRDDLLSRAM